MFAALHAVLFLGALVGWLSALDEAARARQDATAFYTALQQARLERAIYRDEAAHLRQLHAALLARPPAAWAPSPAAGALTAPLCAGCGREPAACTCWLGGHGW